MEDKIGSIVGHDDPWASSTTQFFAFVGILWLSMKIFSFWRLMASVFVLPGLKLTKFAPRGSWALVTGASDGIGKEFALQLAAKGYNIFLVSRTRSKLDELASQLRQKYNVETKILAMDFAKNDDLDFQQLAQIAGEIGEIGLLINNVGLSHSIPVPFVETEDKEMRDIITVNCMGTLRVTALIAPGMVKRRRGLILTMGSIGGVLPSPFLATYSGSKAFLQHWSTALASELAPSGVHVQLVHSYLVTSAMSKVRRSSAMVPNPKTFVRSALSKMGRSGGAQGILATSTPFWAHALMHWAIATYVGTTNAIVVGINRRMHDAIRKKALKKAERDAKRS